MASVPFMPAMTRQRGAQAWYGPASGNSIDIATGAYEDAKQFFERELTNDEHKRDWIRSFTSLEDVCFVVEQAKKQYDAESEKAKKPRKWLNAFASRLTYYGTVLDMLAQHHPEYVALAWGALKFVFLGVLNHTELVTELSKALANIAEVLPRIRLDGSLYPTQHMREAISRIYAHIILFLQRAVKWYTQGPARRAISSILKPYQLNYRDTIDEIKACTATVDAIASASARAETRGQSIAIEEQSERLKETDIKLHSLQQHLLNLQASSQRTEAQVTQMLLLATNHYDLTHTIKLDVTDSKARICDIQSSRILDVLLDSGRSPEDVFQSCQSVARRRQFWRSPGKESAFFIQRLRDWVSISGSAIFIIEAGLRAEARTKDLAVEVTGLLKATAYTVIWHLSEPVITDRVGTISGIFKDLIHQALRHNQTIISEDPNLVNITRFQVEHTLAEWFSLVCLVFSKMPKCFVVVETEDLYRISGRDSTLIRQILQTFRQIIDTVNSAGSIMKLMIVSYGRNTTASLPSITIPHIMASISQPPPASRRLKQHFSPRARAGLGWLHLQPRLVASPQAKVSSR